MNKESKVLRIVKEDQRLMKILEIARSLNLPEWYVGAGVVRNSVWEFLHQKPKASTPIRDVDLIYFSMDRIDEGDLYKRLEVLTPEIKWDIKNSANVHQWYFETRRIQRIPLLSTEQDIRNWPETCSCVGIRLEDNNEILIFAPYGLDDLVNMVFRRNKSGDVITEKIFKWRVENKAIEENWPLVKIVYD